MAGVTGAGPQPARPRLGASVWVAVLALPLAGLALLLVQPGLDVRWEHHPAHFWLVLGAAAVNTVLAYATGSAARRRADARVFLVSLAFFVAAGFLGLHALATPGVLLPRPNAGFALAAPVGLVLAAPFAAASSYALTGGLAERVLRRGRLLQATLIALMAAWAVSSLAGPLDAIAPPERASGPLLGLAVAGIALYAVGVAGYLRLYRRRGSTLVLRLAAALALLAEAMVATAFGRNWHATWWEWHLLMLVAFVLIAYAAQREWHEERFSDLYLDDTAAATRDISVLFADLEGFTSFSERREPHEVSEMLNSYFRVAIPPVVERHGGEIDRIIGDALMVTFNRRGDQPDHPLRAARAALALQSATGEIAREHDSWPRFRVSVNSGEAFVGVLGTEGGRTHTAIGDTVNLASRLEGEAPAGGVTIGLDTARRLPGARTEPLGRVQVKGRSEPVEALLLVELAEASD